MSKYPSSSAIIWRVQQSFQQVIIIEDVASHTRIRSCIRYSNNETHPSSHALTSARCRDTCALAGTLRTSLIAVPPGRVPVDEVSASCVLVPMTRLVSVVLIAPTKRCEDKT